MVVACRYLSECCLRLLTRDLVDTCVLQCEQLTNGKVFAAKWQASEQARTCQVCWQYGSFIERQHPQVKAGIWVDDMHEGDWVDAWVGA